MPKFLKVSGIPPYTKHYIKVIYLLFFSLFSVDSSQLNKSNDTQKNVPDQSRATQSGSIATNLNASEPTTGKRSSSKANSCYKRRGQAPEPTSFYHNAHKVCTTLWTTCPLDHRCSDIHFSSGNSLNRHLKTVHNLLRYVCVFPQCDISYKAR